MESGIFDLKNLNNYHLNFLRFNWTFHLPMTTFFSHEFSGHFTLIITLFPCKQTNYCPCSKMSFFSLVLTWKNKRSGCDVNYWKVWPPSTFTSWITIEPLLMYGLLYWLWNLSHYGFPVLLVLRWHGLWISVRRCY